MDIAALSVNLNMATLSQNVSIAITKQALQTSEAAGQQLVEMLQASHPTLGNSIDLKG